MDRKRGSTGTKVSIQQRSNILYAAVAASYDEQDVNERSVVATLALWNAEAAKYLAVLLQSRWQMQLLGEDRFNENLNYIFKSQLMSKLAFPNERCSGCSPLWDALSAGVEAEAKALLLFGASAFVRGSNGDMPVHCLKTEDALRFFLEHGVDGNSRDACERTPLHRCAESECLELVEALIEHNAQLSSKDSDGATPLHLAMKSGSQQAAHRLVDAGATVEAKDNKLREPLHELAARQGNEQWAAELAERLVGDGYVRARARDELGRQPLHLAAANGGVHLVDHLAGVCNDEESMLFGELDRQDDLGMTPLSLAVRNSHTKCAHKLSKHGATARSVSTAGKVSLHHACAMGVKDMVPEIVRMSFGELDQQDGIGLTPLAVAIRSCNVECARKLIELGATAHSIDKEGKTPLHHACEMGLSEVVPELLAQSGDLLRRVDRHEETPVHVAARLGNNACLQALTSSVGVDDREFEDALERSGQSRTSPLMLAASRAHKAWKYLLR